MVPLHRSLLQCLQSMGQILFCCKKAKGQVGTQATPSVPVSARSTRSVSSNVSTATFDLRHGEEIRQKTKGLQCGRSILPLQPQSIGPVVTIREKAAKGKAANSQQKELQKKGKDELVGYTSKKKMNEIRRYRR